MRCSPLLRVRMILGALLLSTGTGFARGDFLHLEVTSQRVIKPPIPNAGGSATIFGSARATALADGAGGTMEVNRQAKLTASGGPPATLVTNNVVATKSATSPIVPATTAFSRATIDTSNSALTPPTVTIDSWQKLEITLTTGVPPVPPGVTEASGSAQTRDPVIFGTAGFPGTPVASGTTLSLAYSLLDVGLVPHGSIWTSQEFVLPGAFDDPDAIFDTPPSDAVLFFSLTVDNTGPNKVVTFTPGTSTSLFDFSFSRSTADITADALAFFGGASDLDLFVGNVTTKETLDNVTLAGQDRGDAALSARSIPEPSSTILLLSGGLLIAFTGRRKNVFRSRTRA